VNRAALLGLWLIGGMPLSAPGFASAPGAPGAGEVPAALEGIEIVDHTGELIPGDVALVDEAGRPVHLGDFYGLGRPLIVQLVYFQCPMLCNLVLNGYVAGARSIDWVPGRDYEVVTVSFDPRDDVVAAAKKKANYVEALGKPDAAGGWHFLTGTGPQVRRLADALGFRYRWLEKEKQFAHAAGIFVLTPEGRVSRTLYGIEFAPKDLRLSLVEAGEGKLGSPFDRILLYCYQYDAKTHKYALVARNAMKLGGLLTMTALGTLLGVLWSRDRRRRLRPVQ